MESSIKGKKVSNIIIYNINILDVQIYNIRFWTLHVISLPCM